MSSRWQVTTRRHDRGSTLLRVSVVLGIVALLVGGSYGGYLYLRVDRPKYPLPADDPRCPHAMVYVRGGWGRLLEDKLLVHDSALPGGLRFGPAPVQRVLDVQITAFCLDANEVTVDDYGRCVSSGKCAVPGEKYKPVPRYAHCNFGNPERLYHPINCITWNDAKAFCASEGKRLPLEDEWEYAAQGGEAHYDYPWGTDAETNRSCLERWTQREGTCAVRSYPPEAFGLFDMSGNVAEFTQFSCAGKLCDTEPDDLNAPVSGGCWACREEWTRENGRDLVARDMSGSAGGGFRCAK